MANYKVNFFYNLFFGPIVWLIDSIIPKRNNYWGFSVHHIKSDQFIENARAVFEEVKKNNEIKKILFTRNNFIDFGVDNATNFEIVKLVTIKGLWLFMRCKVLFVTHSLAMDFSYRHGKSQFSVIKLNLKNRLLINLWHGIVLKRLYGSADNSVNKHLDRVKYRHYERKKYAGLICSSNVDSYAMATIFQPIEYKNVWLTGLPRNDFLIQPENKLPTFLQSQVEIIKKIKAGKKLILYAPTYRQTYAVKDASYYQFTKEEVNSFKKLLVKHNAILGFRMHYFRNDSNLFNMELFVDNELIFDLGHSVLPDIAPVIRESDIVISDYSSVFIEALYLNKPIFGFNYDFEHYKNSQEGFLYDYDMIFPGTTSGKLQELLQQLDDELTNPQQVLKEKYQLSRKFFYEYDDSENSKRVVEKVLKKINL